jgi:hypothetical protein
MLSPAHSAAAFVVTAVAALRANGSSDAYHPDRTEAAAPMPQAFQDSFGCITAERENAELRDSLVACQAQSLPLEREIAQHLRTVADLERQLKDATALAVLAGMRASYPRPHLGAPPRDRVLSQSVHLRIQTFR